MKAFAVSFERRDTGIVDHPEPDITTRGSVLVRTTAVGVCGTDGELCAFHFGYPPAGEHYLVLGHEAVGRVEAVGAGVEGLSVGALVVPSVRRPCSRNDCPACRSGNQDYCVTGEYTERGIFGAHGFLAERFVEEERYLYPVPQELQQVGVLAEPLSIAEKGLRQYVAIQRRLPWLRDADDASLLAGRRAVVLGAGPVGILGAMLLLERGCSVSIYSREASSSDRARMLQGIGIRYFSAEGFSVEQMAEEIGGIELVYEAAGASGLTLTVLEAMGPNGVFILTGATGGGRRLDLGADALLNRMVGGNLVLAGTVNASQGDMRNAITDLAVLYRRWPEVTRAIITGRYPMQQFAECALHQAGIKEIIDMEGIV